MRFVGSKVGEVCEGNSMEKISAPCVVMSCWSFDNKRIKQSFYMEKEKELKTGLNSKDDFLK